MSGRPQHAVAKRRGLRIAAALAVAMALASGAAMNSFAAEPAAAKRPAAISWLTAGFNATRTNYNAAETTIGPANAHLLHELWSTDLGNFMVAQPVEAAGVNVHGSLRRLIYEGTEDGEFFALRADNGRIVWQKNLGSQAINCTDMPDGIYGIGGAAAISFTSAHAGVVYVAGGDGAVHALNLATGAEQPGWPVPDVFDPLQTTVYGGLNLFGGRLYVGDAGYCDDPPYYGAVTEIGVARHAILHRFYPAGVPSGAISGGAVWGPAGVSIDPSDHDVFAATGNALTQPPNYGYSEAVVELTPSLSVRSFVKPRMRGFDRDFGSTPVLFQPAGCPTTLAAAENKRGTLVVYSADGTLGSSHRQRLQIANTRAGGGFKGDPAWDPVTNMLYVANTSDSNDGLFNHGLVALQASGNCRLSLAWQRTVGPDDLDAQDPPTAANGVVYYSDATGDTEFAFDAATGRELWHSADITGTIYASATIVNGVLLVPSWDGQLHAFGLGKP